jgi:TonB family protein
MTFRRSLYISITAHILTFSGAIAISQYAGGTLVSRPHAILVSLVSPGSGGGGVNRTKQKMAPRLSTITPRPSVLPVEHREALPDISVPMNEATVATSAGHPAVAGGYEGDAGGQQSASLEEEPGGGGSAGFIAPGQWAIIEAAIEHSKNYPRLARERGIEGVVHLRFRLNPSGAVEKIEILKSSGSELLDSASIRSVYRAAPMPYVNGWVEVPIAYVLK